MKHVLDRSEQSQTPNALRHAYQGALSKRPDAASLELQKRPGKEKTGASMTRQFLRIDRGDRA